MWPFFGPASEHTPATRPGRHETDIAMKYNHVVKRITCPVGTGLAGYTRKPTSIGIYDDL